MGFLTTLSIFILTIAVLYGLNKLYFYFLRKSAAKLVTQEEFQENMRGAQIIDVREKVDYDYGHINGARNIPITMFKQRFQGLRKDQPIYLCDANGIASYRAARMLRKNGYTDLYMLKGGYKKWTGKIKSKK